MNKMLKLGTQLIALFLAFNTCVAKADNYEGYTSTIEGVGLWWLDPGKSVDVDAAGDYVMRRLRFGENPEFAMFCDGRNKLYVYELGQEGFICRNVKLVQKGNERIRVSGLGEFDKLEIKDVDEADRKRMLNTIELAKKDKLSEAGQERYTVLLSGLKLDSQGIYTVSKEKLVPGGWTVSMPTKDDVDAAKNVALDSYKQINAKSSDIYKIESVIGYDDARIVKMAERFENTDGSYKQETYTVKISIRDIEIILLPTQYQFMALGGELVSTVVLKKSGNYSLVGHVRGCMRSVGADIDADAIPEIIMENCANTESLTISYYKLFPTVKPLVSYSHF